MEDEYFRHHDAQMVEKLQRVFRAQRDKESLRAATGIADDKLLDDLVTLHISGDLMAAFKLFPLIEVALADGSIDAEEAATILRAAEQHGVASGTPAYAMLETSLKNGPRRGAREVWYALAAELRNTLSPDELATYRQDLLGWAHKVAEASGGLLGIAFTVTRGESKVLEAIEKALTHT